MSSSKLDKILLQMGNEVLQTHNFGTKWLSGKNLVKTKKEVKSLMLDIIGNDTVPYTSSTPSYKSEPIYKSKNNLRTELRKKVKDL